jgi:curved DNA-binding protein CbpA
MVVKYLHALLLLLLLLRTIKAAEIPSNTNVSPRNFYEVLEVKKSATKREVKKAYRRKAILLHPDKNPTEEKEKYEKLFVELAEAYSVLSNEQKRRDYDDGKYEEKFDSNFDDVFKRYGYDGVQDTASNWFVLFITLSMLFVPLIYVGFRKIIGNTQENMTRKDLLSSRGLVPKTKSEMAKEEKRIQKRRKDREAKHINKLKEKKAQNEMRKMKAEKLAAKNAISAADIKAHVPVVKIAKERQVVEVQLRPNSEPWDNEEKQKFSFAVKKYSAGTPNRWGKVAKYMGTRDKSGVTKYVKSLKNVENKRLEKLKQSGSIAAISSSSTPPPPAVWTDEEQTLFENALRDIPRTLSKEKRWSQISTRVGTKTRSECVKRFKQLRASLKK